MPVSEDLVVVAARPFDFPAAKNTVTYAPMFAWLTLAVLALHQGRYRVFPAPASQLPPVVRRKAWRERAAGPHLLAAVTVAVLFRDTARPNQEIGHGAIERGRRGAV
jgi:hypothetical protein